MIRVLIVEDEPPIARALAKMIGEHPSFEVAAICPGGVQALTRLSEGNIDAVFTDIRMPEMDGITLLANIAEKYPGVVSVLISGYQEFDYAKAAIGYRAMDYLLKPLSRAKLAEVLTRIEKEHTVKSKEMLRSQIARSLAGEPVAFSHRTELFVAAACVGAVTQADSELLSPGQAFWNSLDYAELRPLLGRADGILLAGKYNAEKLILLEANSADDFEILFQNVFELLCRRSGLPVAMAAHCVPVKAAEIGRVAGQLNKWLYLEAGLFRSEFLWRDMAQSCQTPPLRQPPAPLDEKIIEAILAQNEAALHAAVCDMLKFAGHEGYSSYYFISYWDKLLGDGRLHSGFGIREIAEIMLELTEAIANAANYDSLGESLVTILQAFGDGKTEGKLTTKHIVEEIEQFLINNYDKSISQDMLATKFGFGPSYISRIFRKYKDTSPSEYLTRYRMSKAKQLISGRPEMLVRDVAGLVGYSDPYYFSKLFKKETGVWPSEYQKAALRDR